MQHRLSVPAAHDAWFRAKVHEALSNPTSAIPHKEVQAHFTRRRAALRQPKA
jgi:DNA-damage-inducible protein J